MPRATWPRASYIFHRTSTHVAPPSTVGWDMSSRYPRSALLGRHDERGVLDTLLTNVRAGQSRVLVLRGGTGVGKSALLDYVAEQATGCRVARAAGVEAEVELAYAGVHQLCARMLDRVTRLPAPQRDALGTAFGLAAGASPDRFLVGLAALGLLAEAAEERPLVCLVDDAQWIDRSSMQALAFVARRLLAERVALIFAVREPSEEPELSALPTLTVDGLKDDEARALLATAVPGRMDPRVQDRIVAEARGNPLALLELPRGLNVADLAGGFALPNTTQLTTRMEQSFLRRFESLPVETRRLLVMAAADPLGDVTLLWRAAAELGIDPAAAAPGVAEGLVEFGARVRFRHPLVRSVIYHSAPLPERQDAHGALADVTNPVSDPDRRAWHRARAAVGPDEEIAAELVRSAERARARGGAAAAAAFLKRATELTPDPGQRATRALTAAQAKLEAAAPDAASDLLSLAEAGPLDELQRACLARMRGQIVFIRTRGRHAPPMLLDAATQLEPLDTSSAREAYLEALGAAIMAARLSGRPNEEDIARTAGSVGMESGSTRPTDLLLEGMIARFIDGYEAGVAPLTQALQAFRDQKDGDDEASLRCLWLACPIAPEPLAPELWDDDSWHQIATQAIELSRRAGALAMLPIALRYGASLRMHTGELDEASRLIEEADAVTEATGGARVWHTSLMLAAWRGDEEQTTALMEPGRRDAIARGEGRILGFAGYVTAVLNNGLSRFDAALAGARMGCDDEDFGFFGWTLVELIEAAVRAGAYNLAADAIRQLEGRTRPAGTAWALGMLARSIALVSDGNTAEDHYREAIAHLERSRVAIHLARARLVYGEWLRREGRRLHAREQLRAAHEMFTDFGAAAFAERARRELLATGETVRRRTTDARAELTAQEAQVARLAAAGHTNPEIGSQLFISPRTAEYHLHKVFAKLGITSRRELRRALHSPARTATAG